MPPGPEGPSYDLIRHVKVAKEAGVDWKREPVPPARPSLLYDGHISAWRPQIKDCLP